MTCANADTPSTLLTQEAAEEAVLCLINEQRVAHGAPPLTLNLKLREAARKHAQAANEIKWWAGGGSKIHTNPVTQSTPQSRIRDAGYCPGEPNAPTNENGCHRIYRGDIQFQANTSPRTALNFWMDSEGHRNTLLNPVFRESGVAVVLGIATTAETVNGQPPEGGAIFVQTFGGCSQVGDWLHGVPSFAEGAVPVAPGTSPTSWYTTPENVQHIGYVGVDQQIHELFFFIGVNPPMWHHSIPSAGKTKVAPGTSPTSWYATPMNVQHIGYVGVDQQINQCFFFIGGFGGWQHEVPITGKPKVAPGTSPTSWYTTPENVQHIGYVTVDQQINECFFFVKSP